MASSMNAWEVAYLALGFEQIFHVKQRVPSSLDYSQQHEDQKKTAMRLISLL